MIYLCYLLAICDTHDSSYGGYHGYHIIQDITEKHLALYASVIPVIPVVIPKKGNCRIKLDGFDDGVDLWASSVGIA
jgi:hypothetical protein